MSNDLDGGPFTPMYRGDPRGGGWELTPEEQRKQQREAWKKAIAKANALARTRRARRKPPETKAGMHRKRQENDPQ